MSQGPRLLPHCHMVYLLVPQGQCMCPTWPRATCKTLLLPSYYHWQCPRGYSCVFIHRRAYTHPLPLIPTTAVVNLPACQPAEEACGRLHMHAGGRRRKHCRSAAETGGTCGAGRCTSRFPAAWPPLCRQTGACILDEHACVTRKSCTHSTRSTHSAGCAVTQPQCPPRATPDPASLGRMPGGPGCWR